MSVKGDGPVLDAPETMDHTDQPYGMSGISAEGPANITRGPKGLAPISAMRAHKEAHGDQGFLSLAASSRNVCRC